MRRLTIALGLTMVLAFPVLAAGNLGLSPVIGSYRFSEVQQCPAPMAGYQADTLCVRFDNDGNGRLNTVNDVIPISRIDVIYKVAATARLDSLQLRLCYSSAAADTSMVKLVVKGGEPRVFSLPVRCLWAFYDALSGVANNWEVIAYCER